MFMQCQEKRNKKAIGSWRLICPESAIKYFNNCRKQRTLQREKYIERGKKTVKSQWKTVLLCPYNAILESQSGFPPLSLHVEIQS